jgi:uncharacterized membrane protein
MKNWTEFIRNVPALLVLIPQLLAIVGKIREAFGSDKVQEAIQAIAELFNSNGIALPAPTTDSTGSVPANPKQERRRRFAWFRNRTRAMGCASSEETRAICNAHNIQFLEETV